MSREILNRAKEALNALGLQAMDACPGKRYRVVTKPVATVHLLQGDREKGTFTVEVEVHVPRDWGGSGCEEETLKAALELEKIGAICHVDGCVSDNVTGVFSGKVAATFPWEQTDDWGGFLCYKDYVWPVNPGQYRELNQRDPMYSGSIFIGMGKLKRTITGHGRFLGENAWEQFKALAAVFAQDGAGTLTHPVWGVRNMHFTELEMTQLPQPGNIAYRFTFLEADENGAVPK